MTTLADLLNTIADLRNQGLKRKEIADRLGISLAKLKRLLTRNALPTRTTKLDLLPAKQKGTVLSPEEGLSLMERCKMILGDRMSEDSRGYLLDGRPASSMQVARAANLRP